VYGPDYQMVKELQNYIETISNKINGESSHFTQTEAQV